MVRSARPLVVPSAQLPAQIFPRKPEESAELKLRQLEVGVHRAALGAALLAAEAEQRRRREPA
jgi:hypothetical protein